MHCLNFPASGNITVLEWKGEEWLKLLFNTTHQGVCAIDGELRFTACNSAAAHMLGYVSQDDLIGEDARKLQLEHPSEPGDELAGSLTQFLKGQHNENGLHSMDESFRRRDGSILPVEYWVRRMRFRGEHAGFIITFSDITQRRFTQCLLETERSVLENISSDTPLSEVLDQINLAIESLLPEKASSVLLLDDSGQYLIKGSAPSLPDGYCNQLGTVKIGPSVGSCGTAAYLKKRVVVSSIETNPLWDGYRELALEYRLRSCWSNPILSSQNSVLGTFAVYSHKETTPTRTELEVMSRMTHLASIAIERYKTKKALTKSDQRNRLLLSATTAVVWNANPDGSFVTPQISWQSYTGQTWQHHRGWGWIDMLHSNDRERAQNVWKQALATHKHFQYECRIWHALSGAYHHVCVRAEPLLEEDEVVTEWAGVITDIHDHKMADLALKESQSRYMFLHDHHPSIFFMLSSEGTIRSTNAFGAQQLGYEKEFLINRPLAKLFAQGEQSKVCSNIELCFHTPGVVHQWEAEILCNDESRMWVRISGRAVRYADSSLVALLVCENITHSKQLSNELAWQASHDILTGLFNRREFESRMLKLIVSLANTGEQHAFCYIDLDQFKVVNDTCGHSAGDELLRQVGELLSEHVRSVDLLARLGGDEFGILLDGYTLEQAHVYAESLRRAIADFRFIWKNKVFSIGVSIGIAPLDTSSGSFAEIMSAADRACYAAKDKGRNRIHLFRKDDVILSRQYGEMEWASRLQRALDENAFVLEYQSIISSGPNDQARMDNSGRHYELLLRLRDEKGGLILPGEFIPAAERFNLIHRVDKWVITNCLRWLAENPRFCEETFLCSINLSGYSVNDPVFLDFIIHQFERYRVSTEKICFEITETAAVNNLLQAGRFISRLRAIGCKFSLDDFGSGVSSFAYLKNLPVNYLKIDGVFVKDVAKDEADYAIVKSFNEIGHSMGMMTIAEFVENEITFNTVRKIGADYMQGYHISPPRPLYQMH